MTLTLIGSFSFFDENGKTITTGQIAQIYYDQGKDSFVYTFIGNYKEFYPNGKVKTQGEFQIIDYESGKIGEWKSFDLNGKLINIEQY